MFSAYWLIEWSHIFAGVLFNCLLLYAIFNFTKKTLGTYKNLILIFAAFDVFLTIMHAIVQPRVMVVATTIFGVAADWDNRYITAFYCSCNTVPFILMNIHFLYRYWSIRRPHLIARFSNKKFIALLFIIVIAEYVIWFLLCTELLTGKGPETGKTLLREESGRRLGHEMKEGWLVMNYWENDEMNVPIFVALMSFNAIMFGCFSMAAVLGGLTYYYIYVLQSEQTTSVQSHNLQRRLFISVCAQTFVPLFFVYIPYILVLNLPFFHLPVFFWDDACMLLTSCFPAWDAVIVIVLMKDYRNGLLGMFWRRSSVKREQTSLPTVQSVRTSR